MPIEITIQARIDSLEKQLDPAWDARDFRLIQMLQSDIRALEEQARSSSAKGDAS